ncbi:hypothetical protein FQN53_003097 [Emmonsiellopsis sp. PD_33]|nr:hypothetical protein FQN53_003097 [Emmonsiellopsis sp. PD_33]
METVPVVLPNGTTIQAPRPPEFHFHVVPQISTNQPTREPVQEWPINDRLPLSGTVDLAHNVLPHRAVKGWIDFLRKDSNNKFYVEEGYEMKTRREGNTRRYSFRHSTQLPSAGEYVLRISVVAAPGRASPIEQNTNYAYWGIIKATPANQNETSHSEEVRKHPPTPFHPRNIHEIHPLIIFCSHFPPHALIAWNSVNKTELMPEEI